MPTLNPRHALSAQIQGLLARFASDTRLYELTLKDAPDHLDLALGSGGLLVEAFAAVETLHSVGARDVIVLSTHAHIDLDSLLGRVASLHVSLSDGRRTTFTGLINQTAQIGSDGGLARYRVRLVPWLWCLTQSFTSRRWQDKTVIEIIEAVFAGVAPYADWRISDEVMPFLADVPPRSVCAQYRESDFDFVTRLLTEEGLSWRYEDAPDAPSGHRVVVFADSTLFPEDASSAHALGGHGIRFHSARAGEAQDSIQAFTAQRRLNAALTTVTSTDYKRKHTLTHPQAIQAPTVHDYGGVHAPLLESYDSPGAYAWAHVDAAYHYASLQQQAQEAHNKTWRGHGTVRTLRPGTQFTLIQAPLDYTGRPPGESPPAYAIISVTSLGINNLPRLAQEGLAELLGALPELLEECGRSLALEASAGRVPFITALVKQATAGGYANHFTAIRADIPWRPTLANGLGTRHHPVPTSLGSQSAIVIGAAGETTPNGADEVYCDRLGRVRVRFHWQGQHDDHTATAWVRVAQHAAGGGRGSQFLPRIGQEVWVQFIEGDIDRPVIVGALYNGQGEGGLRPTPGGTSPTAPQASGTEVFSAATDHASSAQGNLVQGGHSPVWHGASPGQPGHNNAAAPYGMGVSAPHNMGVSAQWGIRTKEFGGRGYNQLVFDDTDQQGRIQLKTTQAATELNLGHLIHTADNYRGSARGRGAELRTDAYGAVRAGAGLLISSYGIPHDAHARGNMTDNAPGVAQMQQALRLTQAFSDAASLHRSVAFTQHLNALCSAAQMHHSIDTHSDTDNTPHDPAPIIALAAQSSLGLAAGQDVQLATGETLALVSGQDSQFITGHQARFHSGQAIGLLSGAIAPGEGNTGLQLIAAQGAIDLQAQGDSLSVQAKDDLKVISANSHLDFAAAKSITLSVAGGASLTISGGNITFSCPGKLLMQATLVEFGAGAGMSYPLPTWSKSDFNLPCAQAAAAKNSAFVPLT